MPELSKIVFKPFLDGFVTQYMRKGFPKRPRGLFRGLRGMFSFGFNIEFEHFVQTL